MSKRKNARTLSEIADAVHSLERTNIIDIGDLLLEAKDQGCERGEWLDWLEAEFDWSVDTAERYMNVARLNVKFRNLRNLKLGRTTLYKLADHKREDDLPAIIKELAKHATQLRLPPRDAERVINIGIGRHRFGDHPDATLVQLMELPDCWEPWHEKAIAALQERGPETDEDAKSIVDEIEIAEINRAALASKVERAAMEAKDPEYQEWLRQQAVQKKEDEEIKDEAESILDGAPPDLPPPATPPEPQTLHADTAWEGRQAFVDAVKDLLELSTKPAARFAGMFTPARLREAGDFLIAVAAADKKEAA